ncbi:uncharacterized protein LOC132695573 isoform X2 [Cylas formicarius]|uniref:uncharacterized protein LOC132695573 isoform X2 n=1 Tax=Cylas formicarius TaxID=197179 RepID=UPI002958D19C|nr:uncharacterized protein LOC132695573 isoform X2 [Cylas formicarius]
MRMFDPNKMEKDAKQPPDNNNRQQPTLGSTIPQQVYQPNTTLPHYYPKSHQHQPQPPFLLNISPGQQMLHATAHRHFQYYPQYAAQQGDSSVHIHRHVPWTNNQPFTPATNKEPTPAQKQVEQKENAKESTSRASKQKVKEGEKKQLRSPSARRPPDARVTMQGWLHKQGSEGLMLWKKRWFVLSEYCLFYYKGSSEDKLLGSILLPSYKVSICGPEDKVNKKFAFKCEHVNMRTYILAADSQELMLRWIHVLNLACNLQSNTDVDQCRDSQTAGKQTNPHAVYVNKPNNGNRGSLHTHTSSNMTDLSNSSQQELSQYNQPLYVNAPPKPRRLTDGFSSPTPDSDTFGLQHGTRAIAKSPLFVYDKQLHSHQQIAQPECVHIYNERPSLPQNVDRRTPDSYGRSKFMRSRNPIDYEDIYSEQAMYKRPLSPVVANDVLRKGYPPNANCVYKGYAPHSEFKQREIFRYDPQKVKAAGLPISRPHSADFLEYKGNQNECDESPVALIQARPKSSLDINMYSDEKNSHVCNEFTQPSRQSNPSKNDSDNYFYSQERYAENMRKSAQYLQKLPIKYQPIDPHQQRHEERYNMNSPNNLSAPHDLRYNPQPAQSRSVLSDGTLLCSHDIDDGSYRGDFSVKMEQHCHHNFLSPNQEQFIRSASARLAQAHEDSMLEEKMLSIEGERKREESMKRLLEWKQRMLQSPLNRKVQGHRATKEQSYMAEGSHHSIEKKQKRPNLNSRKPAHHLVQYNSYSSDDEENGERSKTSMHSQAGWTVDTFLNNSDSLTHAHASLTTAPREPDVPAQSSEPESKHAPKFNESIDRDSPHLTEISSNGALVKAILSEFQSPTSEYSFEDTKFEFEENYMPMSPKSSILQQKSDTNSDVTVIFNEPDENHYVEMTQSINNLFVTSTSPLDSNEQQQYEIVCFGEENLEPVYMELRVSKNQNATGDDLPDIIISPKETSNKSTKSDSSDADDEASKDLDSFDNQNQPRFSLSDTFRPASYYLGASKAATELQDSSDSELVSPPPIPTSSPPPDDDEYLSGKDIRKTQGESEMNLGTCHSPEQYYPKSRQTDNKDCKSDISSNQSLTCESARGSKMSISMDSSSQIDLVGINNICLSDTSLKMDNSQQLDDTKHGMRHAYENFVLAKHVCQGSNSDIKKAAISVAGADESLVVNRPASASSISAEVCSLLVNSNRSTPVNNNDKHLNIQHFQIAPYYYSDISGNSSAFDCASAFTLNNQRESVNGSKRDISHIINPIKCNDTEQCNVPEDHSETLAAEARSVSAEFLNLTDKSDNIDKKNLYESDTLKRQKQANSPTISMLPEERNFYPHRKGNKFELIEASVRKSYSLEGLLENVLNETATSETDPSAPVVSQDSYVWEEDRVWRERLRLVSQRHTKSMDDLDSIDVDTETEHKKSTRGISRDVTYVNDILFKQDKAHRGSTSKKQTRNNKTELKKKGSFLIDRETLRQWDLLSSAPSDDQIEGKATQVSPGNAVGDLGEGTCEMGENGNSEQTASGSISINTRAASISHRDTFPRAASAKRQWELNFQNPQARSITELDQCFNKYSVSSRLNHSSKFYGISGEDSRVSENDLTTNKNKMNVTAGELLGRTHEELVLLLIQLRRQQAQTFQAIESCYNEIETLQVNMHNKDQNKRMENLQKLERIKQNLIELEKQYEKGKPLVNLVDNMVKLGSLYRIPMEQSNETARHIRDRIEFNQHVQEERLLAEEKREWERLETSQAQLQAKVKQLYQLDSLIQEESRNLHNLQRDKEDIERALGGLRCRLVKGFNNPEEIEQARRQQMALENELSRVHFMLAQNSKKLEETVAGNARLEQELLILKQKFQVSKQPRTSPHFSHPGDSLPYMTDSNVAFETDLERVQKKIGDLQKQREELRLQVRQLTDKSNSPHLHQMKQHSFTTNQFNYSKKKPVSVWRETDLDTMSNIDHSCYNYASTPTKPLYINTNTKSTDGSAEYVDPSQKAAELGNDDTLLSSNMLERPEIKTVRIVKRESERRQRDREKTFTEKCDILAEEDDNLLTKLIPSQAQNYFYDHHSLPTPSKSQKQKTSELSPVFKSEAAKQIITEMSKKGSVPQRRAVPREKRRHYTTPHDQLAPFGSLESRRARDDLDIERALRQRIDAPDIVRSTLSNKELKYNENTIDSILSTPNKIVIPERYIPEQLPQPSAEEQERRMKKVESIKKMLSDTTIISSTITTATDDRSKKPSPISKTASSSNIVEEKKQREHLLQLNQILAKQVMEISKAVAAKTLEKLPLMKQPISTEDEDSSPVAPLPLYQQRENFYS